MVVGAQPEFGCNGKQASEESKPEDTNFRLGSQQVSLNLGGTVFLTTVDTLTRHVDTYFAAMLRMHQRNAEAGDPSPQLSFFVDRDPTNFRHILNFLRDGRINLAHRGDESLCFLEELLVEAQFFNVGELCDSLSKRITELTCNRHEEPSTLEDYRLVSCKASEVQAAFNTWVIERDYEVGSFQVSGEICYMVLKRRATKGEVNFLDRLMRT